MSSSDESSDEQHILSIRYELQSGSWLKYVPQIPPKLRVDRMEYKRLWKLHPEEVETFQMYGKKATTHRYIVAYGHDYTFSQKEHVGLPIKDPYLKKLLKWANSESKYEYNGILVNWYRDGSDYIGPHSDSEKELVPGAPILSFSFGATRIFRITHKKDKQFKLDLELENNSLVIMGGEMQSHYKHQVPTQKRIKRSRINITVRAFTS